MTLNVLPKTRNRLRILVFTHNKRAFSSALIGHLYELTGNNSVVLLTEPLSEEYLSYLGDGNVFPGLVRIVTIPPLTFGPLQLLKGNRKWKATAEELIREIEPDLVISENDMCSLFDMYLLRAARAAGVPRITIQAMLQADGAKVRKFISLIYATDNGKSKSLFLRPFRVIKYRIRTMLGHLLVHYILPLLAGSFPLLGKSSYIRRTGASGMRDSQLNLVLNEKSWRVHRTAGVLLERLAILPHPLLRVPKKLFFPTQANADGKLTERGEKIALILLTSIEFGFQKEKYLLIDRDQRRRTRIQILKALKRILPAWRLVLKPHPDCGTAESVRDYFDDSIEDLTILRPDSAVEPYLNIATLIMDLPLSITTTLFTASCAFPEKPIISANVDDEFYGDFYRDVSGIDYVDNFDVLEKLLMRIGDGTYEKVRMTAIGNGEYRKFENLEDAISSLMAKAKTSKT